MHVIVSGAYGRNYKTAEKAVADWLGGKDFRLRGLSSGFCGGTYCSVRDFKLDDTVEIRYNSDVDVTMVTVGREWVDYSDDEIPDSAFDDPDEVAA
jgi:hypothetical protein